MSYREYSKYSKYSEYAEHAGCDYKDSKLAQEVKEILDGNNLYGNNLWLNIRSFFGKNYYSGGSSDGVNEIYREIERLDKNLRVKENHSKVLRQLVDKNFSERINQLKREKYYSAFDYSSPTNLLADIKSQMRCELDAELRRENEELAAIDNMIAKINRITLESTR